MEFPPIFIRSGSQHVLSPKLKSTLHGPRFPDTEDVHKSVMAGLKAIPKQEFHKRYWQWHHLWGTSTLLKLANMKVMPLNNLWVNRRACNKTTHGNIITTPGTDQQTFSTTAWRGRNTPHSMLYISTKPVQYLLTYAQPERERERERERCNSCSICVHIVHFDKISSLNGMTVNVTNFIKPAISGKGR